MADGGDNSAHDRRDHRATCSRQEERPGQFRLSRLFDQVRRVSGGGAEEGGPLVRSINGRVAKGCGQSEQRRIGWQ